MPPNRVVALLTPFLAPLAGAAAAWLAKHNPGGAVIDKEAVEETFLAGTAAAVVMAYKFLTGWQAHEAREAAASERATAVEDDEDLEAAGVVDRSVIPADFEPGLDDGDEDEDEAELEEEEEGVDDAVLPDGSIAVEDGHQDLPPPSGNPLSPPE